MAGQPLTEREELTNWLLEALAAIRGAISPTRAIATAKLVNSESRAAPDAFVWRMTSMLRMGLLADIIAEMDGTLGRSDISPWLRAETMRTRGIALYLLGKGNPGIEALETGLKIAADDPSHQAIISGTLGSILGDLSHLERGEVLLEHSLKSMQETGDRKLAAINMENLALIHGKKRDYTLAKELAREAIAINREMGNKVAEASSLGNYAYFCSKDGAHAEAYAVVSQALAMAESLNAAFEIARCRRRIAVIAVEMMRSRAPDLDACHLNGEDRAELKHALDLGDIAQEFFTNKGFAGSGLNFVMHRAIGLFLIGERDEAVAEARRALGLSPVSDLEENARLYDSDHALADVRWIAGQGGE